MTDDDGKNIFSGPEGDALIDRVLEEVRALGQRRGKSVHNMMVIATEKDGASIYGSGSCFCINCKLKIMTALADSLNFSIQPGTLTSSDDLPQKHVH